MTWFRLLALVGVLQTAGGPVRFDRCVGSSAPRSRWELPVGWSEVSGLALSDDGRIFLHGDETGRIGAIDAETGRWLGSYELGSRSPRGDFEDIAIAGTNGYLITSTGRLYRFPLPPREQTEGALPYTSFETRAGRWCEVEGLAHQADDEMLLIGCKGMKPGVGTGDPAVLRWSLRNMRLATPDHVTLIATTPFGTGKKLSPSAIAVDPGSKRWVVMSSADSRIVVAEATGTIIGSTKLPNRHGQPEGLAINQAGLVYLSDEGGKGPGTVTVYACR